MRRREKITVNIGKKRNPYKIIFLIFGLIVIFSTLYLISEYLIFLSERYYAHPGETFVRPNIYVASPLDIEKKMREKGILFESVMVSSDEASFVVRLDKASTVLFSPYKDVDWQVSSLQQILSRLTIDKGLTSQEGKKPLVVDLRYNKPTVKF